MKLRAARGARRIEAVALAVGRGFTTITSYERGTIVPSVPVLLALAALYGVTVEDLCSETAEPVMSA